MFAITPVCGNSRLGLRGLSCVAGLVLCVLGRAADSTNPPSTIITQIQQLYRANPAGRAGCSVQIEGTVRWANPALGEMVVQDDTAAILVETDRKSLFLPGQQVAVTGDGSMIDGRLRSRAVVNNDGLHASIEQSGTVFLKAGRHPILVAWFDGRGECELDVSFQGPGIPKQKIPDAILLRPAPDSGSDTTNWIRGLDYRVFQGQWQQVPDFSRLPPVKTGTVPNFDVSVRTRTGSVGVEYTGFIELPKDGDYTFFTKSDDGSLLWMGPSSLRIEPAGTKAVVRGPVVAPDGKLTPGRWGEVEGTVRFVTASGQGTRLELECEQSRMSVQVRGADPAVLIRYFGLPVRVSGLAEAAVNEQGELVAGGLWSPDPETLSLAQPASADWLAWPTYSIRALTTIHKGQPTQRITQYALTSADDQPSRDPKAWQLLGSNDGGKSWTLLDQRRDEAFESRFERRVFPVADPNAFNLFRLQVDANSIDFARATAPTYQERILQIAELELTGLSGSEEEFTANTDERISALGDFPPAETKEMAFDGNPKTKWLDHGTNSWIQVQYAWTEAPSNQVIKVRGRVVEQRPGDSLVVEAEQARLRVRSSQPIALTVGQEVEVAGFLNGKGPLAELSGAFVQTDLVSIAMDDQAITNAVLTNAAQILRLSRREQVRKIPVLLRGVVTAFIDASEENYTEILKTIQDDTGGVGIHWAWGTGDVSIQPGNEIEISGHVDAWANAPVVFCSTSKVIQDRSRLPVPVLPSWEALRTGEPENQWIQLHGVVRAADGDRLTLKVNGGTVTARVKPSKPGQLQGWVDAAVTVRGVYHILYSKSFQMLSFMLETPGTEYVQVDKPALRDPFDLAAQPITNLLRGDSLEGLSHRVKIEGVVTHADALSCYVQDDSGVVKAELAEAGDLKAADRVDLVGFLEPGGSLPLLVETRVRRLGTGIVPPAAEISVEEILQGNREGQRVRMQALCLGQGNRGSNQILELLAERQTFRAVLPTNLGTLSLTPNGSRIELTGVCRPESGSVRQRGQRVSSFELLLNTPSEVVILERPAWWTWKHTVALLGLMGVVLGGAVGWIRTLRRKVDERTQALQVEIEEHERTEAKLEEKTGLLVAEIDERKQLEREKERIHKELLDTSRRAGMAEVATGVLHNVGNVLNSVNISATVVAERLEHSSAANVGKVAALLNEHATDLGAFMTQDEKGQKLPGYLTLLSKNIALDQQQIRQELTALRGNIDHIKEIVAMQQNYAKVSGVMEIVAVRELVEDALKMHAGAFVRHGVQLERDYVETPPITIEKHKVLQILVNLFHNAKYACDAGGRDEKRVTVRIQNHGGTRVRIEVADNGVGIPPENLTRIFNHGFTTRKGGHGFGLHSGANAAKELGGALSVVSDGPGKGATFTLELPLNKGLSVEKHAAGT